MQWPWVSRRKLIEAEDKYRRLRINLLDAAQWLGEFPDAKTALDWIADADADYYRPLGQPARTGFISSIDRLREQMRARKVA